MIPELFHLSLAQLMEMTFTIIIDNNDNDINKNNNDDDKQRQVQHAYTSASTLACYPQGSVRKQSGETHILGLFIMIPWD